ncbi:MAG: mechanosensitive ion channel [Pirellulales bacterium]
MASLHSVALVMSFAVPSASAQTAPTPPTAEKEPVKGKEPPSEVSPPPAKVDVQPIAADDQIGSRLERILIATGWFESPHVEVREGVVFLSGVAKTEEHKIWAGNLVRNTQDTVAVVNNLEIRQASAWDFQPIVASVREMWRGFLQDFPYLLAAVVVLVGSFWLASRTRGFADKLLGERIKVPLLRDIIARFASVMVFIMGLYFVMRISGTAQLALTLLGGTGLFGLAVGIAFRDIAENFLASVFLSMQRPFQIGDLVEIVGVQGYVDRLTVRTTVIMSLDGNSVQIPNATVYKSTIRNFTNNPNRRDEFQISIPVDKSVAQAQEMATQNPTRAPGRLASA